MHTGNTGRRWRRQDWVGFARQGYPVWDVTQERKNDRCVRPEGHHVFAMGRGQAIKGVNEQA